MRTHPIQPGSLGLVTGGASGIGLGIAQALLEAGLQVIVTDVRDDHLEEARTRLGSGGDQVHFLRLDVTDRAQWRATRQLVEDRFGALHVLCLNAGVGVLGSMLEASDADWEWITSVNLDGVLAGVETFLPHMVAHGRPGHIVATSSMGGLIVANDGGVYSAAKFGVVALIEVLRRDLQGGKVGATVLCPAAVNTNIYDHERMRPVAFQQPDVVRDEQALEDGEVFHKQILALGRDPHEVGRMVWRGVEADAPYVFTDRNVRPTLVSRRDALLAFA